ncbi:sensor histidine kinase [Pedobacter nototheniae]|uniref:sensor histidine kinase n=1 Tax=Pedobacter nototheniae TaxID=2488994 RepID=UPI00292D6DD3|nr:histidine kinase [Pedobacter nototheniae]
MTENTFLSKRAKRISFLFFAFLLFYLVSFLIDPYANFWKNYFHRDFSDIFAEWVVSFLFCFLIAEGSIQIHIRLNKRFPWTSNPLKRLILESALNICVVTLLILMEVVCVHLIYSKTLALNEELSSQNIREMLQWFIVSLLISFVIVSINTGSYLINNWKNTELKVSEHKLKMARLRQASIEAELNALRLQLDPHFIFNNLSVLSELILENPKLGYEYSENFSKVYRFLLINSKKNTITLADELKFLKAYIFLIENRIGAGVQFEIAVNEDAANLLLPPLTLQLLIENALKHNITSKSNPLKIKIYSVESQTVVVENTLHPVARKSDHSMGIGLANIISRFTLLSKTPPQIVADENYFKVMIYLMHYDQ